jgi:hypothetical protein
VKRKFYTLKGKSLAEDNVMPYRVLNSNSDPHRTIRLLRLKRDLRQGLEMYLDSIRAAEDVIKLTHTHGRALGVCTGLRLVSAITQVQFNLLAEAYMDALQYRLAVLAEASSATNG